MPLHLPELLSPAGDESALHAAIDSGANAVYLGYKAFGARASAVNFDDEALRRAVEYAHLYHARVHVTVNTLVKPHELDGVYQALEAIDQARADAVIVQDLGVARIVRDEFPRLQLHASTQMALCNADGALAAKKLGFDRVVLARECSLEDIQRAVETGVEIEVFAHGALCTAVSGRCLMSSMSGGRSGNRGRCAQPCRQCFRMDGEEAPIISLRDLCTLDNLPGLCSAGVSSLKIEGRLKSAEYVAVVTSVYRRALDLIARGEFSASEREKEKLLQIFNRGGFTRGHAFGAEDAEIITPDRVSHDGLPIGEIVSVRRDLATMRVTRDLNDGDSLQLRGQKDEDMRYSGHDVPAGGMATIRLRPGLHVEAGMQVGRLSDAKQLEEARAHQPSPIEASLFGCFQLGQPMMLSMTDGETSVTVTGPVVEAAQKRASTADDARKQLEKLGGTPFTPVNVQAIVDDSVFLPVSALNALRRDAVEKLTQARINAFARTELRAAVQKNSASAVQSPITPDTLAVVFSDVSVAHSLREAGADLLIWEPRSFTPASLKSALSALPDGTWLRLPPQLSQEMLDEAAKFIREHASRLGGVVCESVGQLFLDLPLPKLCGEGVPVCNPEALSQLEGVCGFTRWPEWTYQEQKNIGICMLPSLLKVYGRERLMLLNHCPHRVKLGLSARRASCTLCKTETMTCGRENAVMTDRKGYRFPLMRTHFPEGCEITVLGALPTDLSAYDSDRVALKAGKLLVFTVETPEEQLAIVRRFKNNPVLSTSSQTTSGHWLRGVE
ncbi:MAG: U32 family peptidase [Clostridia bacterium]|nr:U32 family peptidase [Clostridia bacterium]